MILAGIAILIALLDLLIAPILARPGAYVLLPVAISTLCWHLLVFARAARIRGSSRRFPLVVLSLSMPVVALKAWSILVAVSVALQSRQIARDQPYCIARTEDAHFGLGNDGGYAPLRALEGLRGTRLFTTFTGHKDTSRWWFHAVLVVAGEKGREYWNWSISRMRFEPFHEPNRFVQRPTDSCQPTPSFLVQRPWL